MNRKKPVTRRPLGVHRTRPNNRWISRGRKKSINSEPSNSRQKPASALLVYAEFEPLHTLRVALASQGIDTWRARSCQQALSFLANFRPVHVIFTDKNLPDGTWLDLVRAKRRTSAPLTVVAREMDARLSSDIIQQGGAGLIVPPFAASDLTYPVRSSGASRCSNQGSPRNRRTQRIARVTPVARFDRKENSQRKRSKTL
jgi:PleD family two-component response regulator